MLIPGYTEEASSVRLSAMAPTFLLRLIPRNHPKSTLIPLLSTEWGVIDREGTRLSVGIVILFNSPTFPRPLTALSPSTPVLIYYHSFIQTITFVIHNWYPLYFNITRHRESD